MKLVVGLGPRSDIAEIAEYIDLRTPGRGSEFIDAVETGLREIEKMPRLQPLDDDGPPELETRLHLLETFRYRISFVIHQETIFILGVGHVHRLPGFWLDRLQETL